MNKINSMLKSISENFRRVTSHYPVTMVLVILTSLCAAVFIDQSGTLGKFMEDKGLPFLLFWGIGTYFAETCWTEKKAAKWFAAAAAGLAAACLIRFGNSPSETVSELASRWKSLYVIVLCTMGVYLNYRKSELPFDQYCIRVCHELSRLGIICSIVSMGISLVMAVFVELMLSGDHFMLIIRAEMLVMGCLLGSGLLDAQIRTDRELPRFYTVIVKYLLMVMLTAAFAIIYGYILKIIITRVVPSNEIFRILAGLFAIGMPIWTLAGSYEEDQWPVRIARRLPYVFTPFLFLQGYAIRERIAAYGMTPARYLCLALMAFEIIYIAVYALRRRETGIMLPVAAVMAAVCLVIPYVNMYSVSIRNQKAIFDRYIGAEFKSLSADDQISLAGAYYYLADDSEGKTLLADADPEKIEAIRSSGLTAFREFDEHIYFNYDFPVIHEDISSFSRITLLTNESNDPGDDEETYDLQKIGFYDTEGDLILNADLTGFINQCIAARLEDRIDTPGFPGTVELEDGKILRMTECHGNMNNDPDHTVHYLYLQAILLER